MVSKNNAERIAQYACSSKENFAELVDCFTSSNKRLAQVAGYSLNKAVKLKPELVKPHLKVILAQLDRNDVHGAVIRNAVNILELIDIPEKYHGAVMNKSFAFIEDPSAEIAVRASSLTVLFNLSKNYPEIRDELKLIIESKWDTETAAFKSRGRKILHAFSKQDSKKI